MKILFENQLVHASTLSAVDTNPNYPASNLIDPILKKRWQSTENSDVITATFSTPVTMDSLYFGWTNADTVGIDFYDATDTLLYTIGRTVTRATEALDERITEDGDTRLVTGAYYEIQYNNSETFYFSQILVSKIQIQLDTSEDHVFLGGISTGAAENLPDPLDTWEEIYRDGSNISESPDGQILQNYIRPLTEYTFEMRDLTRDQIKYWTNIYLNSSKGKTVWADFFNGDHDYMRPIYCAIINALTTKKTNNRFSMKWNFREAR